MEQNLVFVYLVLFYWCRE